MILLDSNIVIYLRDPTSSEKIISQLPDERLHTCNVIIAEVLGHPGLGASDSRYFGNLFAAMKNHDFSQVVTQNVIQLRKNINIQLPDAIISATALVNNLTLWTHNTKDFSKVPGLSLYDPLKNNFVD